MKAYYHMKTYYHRSYEKDTGIFTDYKLKVSQRGLVTGLLKPYNILLVEVECSVKVKRRWFCLTLQSGRWETKVVKSSCWDWHSDFPICEIPRPWTSYLYTVSLKLLKFFPCLQSSPFLMG